MSRKNRMWMLTLLSGALISCSSLSPNSKTESQRFREWADQVFQEKVERYPTWQTYLGIKKDYDKLNDISEEMTQKELEHTKSYLQELQEFDYAELDESSKLSYQLLKEDFQEDIADFKYRYHGYIVSQMFGIHSSMPSFMINMHQVANKKQAEDYVSRLNDFSRLFDQLVVRMKEQQKRGVILPKFLFSKVIKEVENLQQGKPLTADEEDHVLWADFQKKVEGLELTADEKEKLLTDAKVALQEHVGPSYKKLETLLKAQKKLANDKAGVWKLPQGEAFYRMRLERSTTTKMSPEEVHNLGLEEVARIHGEMKQIMKKVGYKGDLTSFFKHLKSSDQFYYPNTDAGREAYFAKTQAVIDHMKEQLGEVISLNLKSELIVKRVEAFREKTAASAFYQGPAPDGSRPGIYYVNLYDMKDMPKYELEALAYHEAVPGHHLQISIATQLDKLPKFRRHGHYTAYSEGWGLYAEWFPKSMGLYQDPYSDFGRLSMELWRAVRLVLDTGLHHKKWTREKAIDYMQANTPVSKGEVVREVERYIVMPGQATSYKVGMLKILELRKQAEKALGDRFSVSQFHDEVLRHGPVPLDILERLIEQWIEKVKSSEAKVAEAA